MPKPVSSGLLRIMKATVYSTQGLRAAFRHEAAFRQEMVLIAVGIIVATFIAGTLMHWLLLVGTGLLVLIVELLNSAIEAVVDRLGDEWHELSGRAKDMGSAAVFVSLLLMAAAWLSVLWLTFFDRLSLLA